VRQQRTINNITTFSGIGIHSGVESFVTLKPAAVNSGVIFVRSDLQTNNHIVGSYTNVIKSSLCTSISNSFGVSIKTVEHFMAALWACEIDNVVVEVHGAEMPILDGSSRDFIRIITEAETIEQNYKIHTLKILAPIVVDGGLSSIAIEPSDEFIIDLAIDFDHPLISAQKVIFDAGPQCFIDYFANARTFGFVEELEYLNSKGLALGANLTNVIALTKDHMMNEEPLRYKDEFVRHKILDIIGDLRFGSSKILGKITTTRPSHALNNDLLRSIFSKESNYAWIN
jgi:UDP-3-O-[3-hydroxymyristoyl] N-acetylglucosamine deacetylase